MSRKSQTQKKRHTKPCRYYQVNRCPHTADVCDFAHVIVNPAAATSHLEHTNGVCQHYATGHCSNGAICGYPHVLEAPIAKPIDTTFLYDGGRDWAAVASPEAPYLESPTISSNYTYPHQWPQSPFLLNTSYPPFVEAALTGMPARCRDSIDTITTTTSLSTQDSDEISSSAVTDDPRYGEHSHSYQSQVCIVDEPPLVHVTPFYAAAQNNSVASNAGPAPPYEQYGSGYQAPNTRVKPRNPSKPPSKQKMMKYKTKPCKFFVTSRGCPNGSVCTFIHDEMEFPESPVSKGELRRDFFPIPWRVIGGGVLVGVKREGDGDEREAESSNTGGTNHSSSKQNSNMSPIKIVTRQRSNSIPPTPSTAQVKVERLFSAESPGVL